MNGPITPLTPAQIAAQEQQAAHEKYLMRALVGFDQFVNVLTDGDPDETISARASRAAQKGKGWGVELSRMLDVFQRDHGAKAQAGDLGTRSGNRRGRGVHAGTRRHHLSLNKSQTS
jgi:hypothetical protein